MPEIPHEYTVRGKQTAGVEPPPVEWHDWFAEQIRVHGYKGKWARRTYVYLDHAGFKFWVIGQVINRERLSEGDRSPSSIVAAGGGHSSAKPVAVGCHPENPTEIHGWPGGVMRI